MEEAQEPERGDAAERVSAPAPPAEEGGISLHNFRGRLAEHLVHFHAMRLQDSLFLWVGDGPQLSNLAVAMCTPRGYEEANSCCNTALSFTYDHNGAHKLGS